MGIFSYAPPPLMGGRQPHQPRRLPVAVTAVPAEQPPFSDGGPVPLPASVIAINQPPTWTYSFMGNRQPFGARQLSPGIPGQSINLPPVLHEGRGVLLVEITAIWQPNPWTYSFMGGAQPFGPKRLSSGIPGQSADPPPVTQGGGPYALKLEGVAVNQSDWSSKAWPFVFMGNRQPYAQRLLPPSFASVVVSPFPFSHRGRMSVVMAIRAAWNPPPPDFQMQLYATRPTPQRLRPTARGYIIL
ncbi:MAG: hypothetical protein V4673_14625 [Pseudomonadota bacterium]